MSFLYTVATIAFSALGVLFAGAFLMDILEYISKTFYDDIHEIPAENQSEIFIDDFKNLYMNVADGDSADREYWLESSIKDYEKE